MYVVIVGAGEVGSAIAESLAPSHDVAVIDIDGDCVEQLMYDADVLGIEGDGADLDTLQEANVRKADILIASTDDDETNIVTCGTTMTVTDAFTISRVKSAKFLRTWQQSERASGVDVAVNPREATAEEITRFTREQHAENVAIIESDRAEVLEIEIDEESVLIDRPIRESVADLPEGVVIGAITRSGELIIPRGDTVIEGGDHVVVFVDVEYVDEASSLL